MVFPEMRPWLLQHQGQFWDCGSGLGLHFSEQLPGTVKRALGGESGGWSLSYTSAVCVLCDCGQVTFPL